MTDDNDFVVGLGWLPDVPKVEDYGPNHARVLPLLAMTSLKNCFGTNALPPALPTKVDLREMFSPIESQGGMKSCTANTAVALVEYFERRAAGRHVDASRLFVYKNTRKLARATGDTGAQMRTTMKALVTFGVPPEEYWPYDPEALDTEPSAFEYAFAQKCMPGTYFRLDPNGSSGGEVLTNVKRFLANGFPSAFGMPIYAEYKQAGLDGRIPFPGDLTRYIGGHTNVAVGYDDDVVLGPNPEDRGAVLVRNSWGVQWGNNGYGWLSYRYVTEGLAVDWWTITKLEWLDAGQFDAAPYAPGLPATPASLPIVLTAPPALVTSPEGQPLGTRSRETQGRGRAPNKPPAARE